MFIVPQKVQSCRLIPFPPRPFFVRLRGREGFVEGGFERGAAGVGGVGEAGFQFVAEGHEFIDFGDDALLLGEGPVAESRKRAQGCD